MASSRRGVPHARSLNRWAQAACAHHAPRGEGQLALTIRVVGAAESRRLNRTWRSKDKPTNVLSFPAAPLAPGDKGVPSRFFAKDFAELGDLAICAPVVAREAREQGKPAQAHWAHMVVHGVLHLLGFDHENDRDASVMEAREVKILALLGYDNPYA
ncbi:rRNA maturation RNase YbeY [Steroidobacter sp. S1-65]|uniref:Endoribonuclease YbeY n=1 Tax=Steroidobacter gossypii TaxID=2805490 RepID=A0ABS1X4V3_9GAMM|nr:rRNA maturation RNase YbeY [Steroidobacter gossypii]